MKVGSLMNLDIYNSIHRSVDGIIAYLDQESDVVQGLDKLYNGGWVLIHNFRLSNPQADIRTTLTVDMRHLF